MFVGFVELEQTLSRVVQCKNGAAVVAPDAAPTFRVYGIGNSPVLTGVATGPIDSQTGLYRISIAATAVNGFAHGTYTIRVAYSVSSAARVETYSFTVV